MSSIGKAKIFLARIGGVMRVSKVAVYLIASLLLFVIFTLLHFHCHDVFWIKRTCGWVSVNFWMVAFPVAVVRMYKLCQMWKFNVGVFSWESVRSSLVLLLCLEKAVGTRQLNEYRASTVGMRRPKLRIGRRVESLGAKEKSALWNFAAWVGVDKSQCSFRLTSQPCVGAAGVADLRTGVIDINVDPFRHPDTTRTVVCHELAHIWMKIHNVHAAKRDQEEPLTDLTCVFLGMGDIMLNGCMSIFSKSYFIGSRQYVEMERMQVGYMNPMQLAIAEILYNEATKSCSNVSMRKYNLSSRMLIASVKRKLAWHGVNFINKDLLSPEMYYRSILASIENGELA